MRLFSGKLLFALFLASASLTSQAQPPMAQQGQMQISEEQKNLMVQMRQAQMALQQNQQKLQVMQSDVIDNSAELQKQRDSLRAKVTEKMNVDGYDSDAEMKALGDIIQKYQASGEKPSQEVIMDFQKRQRVFQQKQMQVLQDKEVQSMAQKFEDSVMQAVEKKNPDSADLIKTIQQQTDQVRQLQQQFQAAMAK
ncbi:hypothetical protein [Thiomicrorhabdus sp. 6S3-12]|uniref:hypothetical protein n=1 Tax=Thiomicrorhabdus sp. 6S3-12 TaxID=2819681 RepID=UPI001AAC5896|nr:hypothetical protein [Thiomicrorhabdus sp. 6S3-12]MBO1924404.1 hypothetical protein [Thiomicrorhabdus sp. 6S3-12]